MLRTVLKLFVCLSMTTTLFSQSRLIQFKADKREFLRNVEFYTKDGTLIRTFNIDANDPYNSLAYPILQTSKNGIHTYDVSKEKNNKTQASKARSNAVLSGVYDNKDIYLAICYNLTYYDTSMYNTLGAKSTIFIMDSTGTLLNKLEIDALSSTIHEVIVSRDGKHIFLLYGDNDNIDHHAGAPMQFQIRRISDNSLITNELFAWKNNEWVKNYPFRGNYSSPASIHGYFFLQDNNPTSQKSLYRIYDPYQKKVYIRELDHYLRTYEFKSDGLRLKNGETLLFNKDFQVVPMGK